jgi:hypothetical protein
VVAYCQPGRGSALICADPSSSSCSLPQPFRTYGTHSTGGVWRYMEPLPGVSVPYVAPNV